MSTALIVLAFVAAAGIACLGFQRWLRRVTTALETAEAELDDLRKEHERIAGHLTALREQQGWLRGGQDLLARILIKRLL